MVVYYFLKKVFGKSAQVRKLMDSTFWVVSAEDFREQRDI